MYASGMVRKITKEQIKIIYTLGSELGIVDRTAAKDSLHELVESVTKCNHVSELTSIQANSVISRLKANMRGFGKSNSKKAVEADSIPGMASLDQKRKIWRLMYELREYDEEPSKASLNDRLRGFLRRYAGIDDMRFLTAAQAWRAIEGLKGVVKNAKIKASKGS